MSEKSEPKADASSTETSTQTDSSTTDTSKPAPPKLQRLLGSEAVGKKVRLIKKGKK